MCRLLESGKAIMCEYCLDISENNDIGAAWLSKQGNIFCLESYDHYGISIWSEKINYCPMCGRKLVADVQ